MGDISAGCTFKEVSPNAGLKIIQIETAATADTADTVPVTLASYGAGQVIGVLGFVHTTENSVVVQEQPTTAVSAGVLTITVGGSTLSDKKREYIVYCK